MSGQDGWAVDKRDVVAFAFVAIPYLLLVRAFWWVCDDAFISFRYAGNWVGGHGLRYNLGEHPPVEGFSNFLWVVVSAGFELLGGDPVFWVPIVSLLCGLALLALVYHSLEVRLGAARPVAVLATWTLAVFPPFDVWTTSGLETMAFSLALFLAFDALVLRSDARPIVGGVAALALCLLRIEGIAWALLIAVLAVGSASRRGRAVIVYTVIVGAGFLTYFLLRYQYYGLAFPIPVYTKVHFGPDVALRGFRYVATFFVVFLTPFLVLPAAFVSLRSHGTRWLPVVLMAFAFPAYAIVVGGDWMTMGRFLVPGLAFQTLLIGASLQWLWERSAPSRRLAAGVVVAAVIVGLVPGWNVHLVPRRVRDGLRFRYFNPKRTEQELWVAQSSRPRRAKEVGLALARISKPGDSLVVGAIGSIGYYSELFIYDRFGLVTREVALRPRPVDRILRAPGHDGKVSRSFFLDQHPTYIVHLALRGPDIAERLRTTADAWRQFQAGTLWRRYAPDFVEIETGPEAGTVVMVLRAVEEEPNDPILKLPRPERRRARAARAEKLWARFYERVSRRGS